MKGLNVAAGKLTYEPVARDQGLEYTPAAGRARGGAHRLAAMFLKERLAREGDVLNGVMGTIPSAVAAQAVAAAGADFLLVDREHAPIGREALHAMIAATAGTECGPLVRVPAIDEAEVKLALDAGAEGISFPMVRSAADVERCVALLRYPPDGTRGWGPFVAHSRHGTSPAEYARRSARTSPAGRRSRRSRRCRTSRRSSACRASTSSCSRPSTSAWRSASRAASTRRASSRRWQAVERAAAAPASRCAASRSTRARAADLAARGYRALLRGIDVFMLADAVAALRDG